jgi:hypothetical protein
MTELVCTPPDSSTLKLSIEHKKQARTDVTRDGRHEIYIRLRDMDRADVRSALAGKRIYCTRWKNEVKSGSDVGVTVADILLVLSNIGNSRNGSKTPTPQKVSFLSSLHLREGIRTKWKATAYSSQNSYMNCIFEHLFIGDISS